ncbi:MULTISPECIES: hypothetical protein [Alloalcanivorax]|jgi:hypothetical protein|uniref:hypothetical protein n=1 Tax=Alloalcanivorax TaxID=3020832 RepID=UPI0003B81592|nr:MULTISPECIES: hypothetical protein [Alloalcanivorax]ARB45760.1 hypothetical protein P40_10340 [Alloalcanivorax xenomutans]ERS13037.1 hypothetical protein Q668_01800 [Alcanivorax sp. PN-3]MCE7525155.1 hypothetical protein [Alloalcanivorax xenomutans]GGJ84188.1 hypothetical protein GCM10007426_11630 [Alloalcanivorax dieselolei]
MRFKPSFEELLDEMSTAIAVHLGIEIGKASLDNSPWHNALNAIKKAAESKTAELPMTPEQALLQEAKHALTAIALCPRSDSEIEDLLERIDQAEVTACRIADFLFESSNPEAARTREGAPQRQVQRAVAYDAFEEQLVVMTRTSTPTHALKEQDLSALQRDADRYRWLRHDAKVSAVTVGALRDKYHLRTLLAGDLDAVLDAARRRQTQRGGADHGA